jgi:hypothetical protein
MGGLLADFNLPGRMRPEDLTGFSESALCTYWSFEVPV